MTIAAVWSDPALLGNYYFLNISISILVRHIFKTLILKFIDMLWFTRDRYK